jgi:hypothetical protein
MRDAREVLDDLTRAGVHIIVVHGDGLRWRTDPQQDPVPGVLFDEFIRHKAAVLRVLRDVPAGCPVPHICTKLGICPREIVAGACQVPLERHSQSRPEKQATPVQAAYREGACGARLSE